MRFITEIAEAVRAHWPDGKPLFVRLSVEDSAGWDRNRARGLRRFSKPGASTSSTARPGHHRGGADPRQGNQIQLSGAIVRICPSPRRHHDHAVGLIIHGDQAEQILRDEHADLIAVGREILNNPNWPMDAALKLGVEGPFRNVPPQFGYWLGTRAKRGFGTRPSTWQNGLNETR